MRFAGLWMCSFAVAAAGCVAGRIPLAMVRTNLDPSPSSLEISGVWDAMSQTTVDDGVGAGDTRIEKQEWHLTQAGSAISGYYIAALTFVSGDGRPYLCSRQPQFSAMRRFDVSGRVRDGLIEIQELGLEIAPVTDRCDAGTRRLSHYRGRIDGDVLTLVGDGERHTLHRIHEPGDLPPLTDAQERRIVPSGEATDRDDRRGDRREDRTADRGMMSGDQAPLPATPAGATVAAAGIPADVSGLWEWEHHGTVPGGDEKQEREEWHVVQEGSKLTGYYDRIVHQVSVDGHAYRCSMTLDFQISTRYQFNGEVRGNDVRIYESSFEVLSPNACDNGKRRLDAYEGQASLDEIKLLWGIGGQILHRPRPDVPTQRF